MSKILAIDDDIQILTIIKKALENEQHSVDILDRVEKVNKDNLSKYDLILMVIIYRVILVRLLYMMQKRLSKIQIRLTVGSF
ncbi:MAG: hypothetical protein ACERKN_19415 [Velocimicrobium sp.]